MSHNRMPAATANRATIRVRLDDSAVSKDKIPAPAEISELMGRTAPISAYSGLVSAREWGKMTAIYGMTFQNIQSLPSLRGKEISFDVDGPQRNQKGDIKDFMTYAVGNPSALLKTLPIWHWDAPAEDESKAANVFSNVLANIVTTPNILYSFFSTIAEVTTKTAGSILTQPFHFLWKGMKLPDANSGNMGQKSGFFARAAKAIPRIFTQPFNNIRASWQGIKKNWREFAADTKTPRWKKVLKGIGLGAKTVVQTIGLGIAAFPPVSWTLALAGWAAGQTCLYVSNALNYVRNFIDGLTTLIVNAPKALTNDAEKTIICKTAAKTMGKSALLLLPTLAILLAAIFIPGGQILPAIAPAVGAKILAVMGLTSAGAQLASGLINYKFAEANFKKAQAAAPSSNQQIVRNITTKPAVKAKPVTDKTPLLASSNSDSTSNSPVPSPKASTPDAKAKPVTEKTPLLIDVGSDSPDISPASSPKATLATTPTSTTLADQASASVPHYSTFLELHQGENIQEKIRHLRERFLLTRSNSMAPSTPTLITTEASPIGVATPAKDTSLAAHQRLHWNEHQDNAWVEYKHNDTHQYVSELVAVANDLNPERILLNAIPDATLRDTLEPGLKAGIKQLSASGKPLNKTNLLALVKNDDTLAETLAEHYKKAMRQTLHNHYTHIDHDYPADKLLDLAIRQVDSFIKINGTQKTLAISNAWDANYVEAIMLYAAAKNYKCKNKSAYTIPAFSSAHVDAFKDLIELKPYLGHRNIDQNKPTAENNPTLNLP
jgi:hypothetical protein